MSSPVEAVSDSQTSGTDSVGANASKSSDAKGAGSVIQQRAPVWVKSLVSLVLVLICLPIAIGVFSFFAGFKAEPPREEPTVDLLRVEVFRVERAPLQRYLTSFGTARADRVVTVSAEVSGKINEVNDLRIGRHIEGPVINVTESGQSQRSAGDIIVQIDPVTYRERVEQARTMIQQDEASLKRLDQEHQTNEELLEQQKRRIATIERDLQRKLGLLERGAGSESDVERARLEIEQYRETEIRLKNELELFPVRQEEIITRRNAHENDLRLAELELEKATVRAPFSGVISEVWVEQGQYARMGDPLVEISDSDVIEVPIPLSLHDAASVEGLISRREFPSVQLAKDAGAFNDESARTWTGEVKRLAPQAEESTRTIMAYVEVINREQEQPLKPGTFVYARITGGEISPEQGVLVPRDAIVDGTVFVSTPRESVEDENATVAVARPIVIRDTFQTLALVSEGIREGDPVVMTNLDIVADGTLLDVRGEHGLESELQRLRLPNIKVLTRQTRVQP